MSSDRDIPPALPTLAEIEAMEALLGRAQVAPWRMNAPDWPGGRKHGSDWQIASLGSAEKVFDGKERRSPIYITTDCVRCSESSAGGADDDAAAIVALRNAAPSLFAAAREAVRLRGELARVRERCAGGST